MHAVVSRPNNNGIATTSISQNLTSYELMRDVHAGKIHSNTINYMHWTNEDTRVHGLHTVLAGSRDARIKQFT